MKTFKFIFALSFIVVFISSCASNLAMNKATFYQKNKVGIIIIQDSIAVYKAGAQGLLDMAISSGRKYKEGLNTIAKTVSPEPIIKNSIENKFSANNKEYIFINEKINIEDLSKFNTDNKVEDKKYYKYDVRHLKQKYGIDELMIVKLMYGLNIRYYGMIELGRSSTTYIFSEIINLDNNEIIFKDTYSNEIPIKGKWNEPPHYENLRNYIEQSIEKASNDFEQKL